MASWVPDGGTIEIRLYISDGEQIVERCFGQDQRWVEGQFTAPGGHVSVTHWLDDAGIHLRVYATTDNVATQEWCFDPKPGEWVKGQLFEAVQTKTVEPPT